MTSDDEVLSLLAAWRADIDSEPQPSLIMVEVAYVLICAAQTP
ncbi:hypothetical protein [Alloactinosynnema sp. L-07]|nr:hypothetical protein [Alloactinosynnema sp. L-07]CRK62021.1 hypothetical protein [Alloactinosynnema sp. L-07]